MKFKEERKVEIQGIEIGAYHPLLGYAGRIDRLALIDGIPSIIDIKTGTFAKASQLQMILYGMMFTYNGVRPNLMLVHLNDKGTYKPNIVTYKDEKYAMSAIRINQWKNR
jgi:RecB family exonuclease